MKASRMAGRPAKDERRRQTDTQLPQEEPGIGEANLREAWLRAEACCECEKQNHAHSGRCNQFLVWTDRGGTGKGGWEVRVLRDPRRPACEVLCAACYAKVTGKIPRGE